MKRITQKFVLLLTLFLVVTNVVVAQNFVPFTTGKYTASLKGDMLLIGNNVLNRVQGANTANVPHNIAGNNNDFDMQYVDVDSDPTTFCSSTADLTIPSKATGCYAIKYAGLYWAGMYKESDITSGRVNRANINTVKFKLPGAANYSDITGNVIYDSYPANLSATSKGYTSYADVTTLVQGLADANGTYGVANLIAGSTSNTSAGWTLFIVYEDPGATAKNITLFDGFSSISSSGGLNIPISGFTTIPVGPVRAKLAFSSLEGDLGLTGDRLRLNGASLSTPDRIATNFFNSSIDYINPVTNTVQPFTTRNLNSSNLLGFDAGIINVNNPGNSVIANGSTTATIRLESTGDAYFYYMNAFAVEIIQPNINLIKIVRDLAFNNIANATVALGQELYYDLDFQNIGNDDAVNFTITDVLPTNVDFLESELIVPPGVTYIYNAVTHTIVFTIPTALVRKTGAQYKIRIKVRVLDDCKNLRDACSNEIKNQAFKTYNSANSGNVVENGAPSSSGINACLILEPGTTNFLANIDDCTFAREEVLCGSNVVLTAGSGYINYQWHNGAPPTAANAIPGANSQTYTTTTTGVFSVVNTAPAPCLSITETVTVVDFNGVVPNPIIPFADEVATCTNDGSALPKIFLCGAGDVRSIQTNILNATSIIWEKLNEASCAATPIVNCPNTNTSCTWTQVGTGPDFNANAAGQYRVRIVFQNGCFRTYYFNVYQNLFSPTEVHKDIICGTNGSITVSGVPSNYEYSLSPSGPWQPSNVFSITTAGNYTVYIRQIGTGVGNCVFTLPNIPIRVRAFTVDVIPSQPLCNGGQGSIRVQVNNVEPQYTYQLFLGATLVNSAGPINSNDYIFSNLNPGTYTVIATTTDGCTNTQNVTLTQPAPLNVTAAITIPLTCNPGEITIYPVGGTPPYIYEVSTITGFQSTPEFEITTAGTYNIKVTDFNNCVATTSIIVNQIPPPVFTVSQTNILCYGSNTGAITFNVSNSNGYSISYSIDNGITFNANPSFTGLLAGTYQTIVQYSLGGTICTSTTQPIIITEPATALTASGGVSQLAGCGPFGEGEVRITNPQGGTPPYQYSFNNGVSYGNTNTFFLPAGTYTVYVRDAKLCVFPMVVTIDPAPNPPTIVVNNPDFNCNGTATATVTVNNNGGNFAYTYLIDGVPNTNVPSNIFQNVPCGPHTIKVKYQNLNIPTYSNLLFEDFGRGASTTSPGIASAYCFNNQPYPASTPCGNNLSLPPSSCGSRTIEDNQYSVTSAIIPNNCNWHPYRDHTSNGTDPIGRFLAVNIGNAAGNYGILYSKTINDVLPNQPVNVELYLANLLRVGVNAADPDFILELVDTAGNVIATQSTGIIDNTVNDWQLKTLTLNPGNNTTLNFVIRSGSILYNGNDAAIDDIRVFQLPIACITEVDFPINVACGQAFTASVTSASNVTCNGANNGQITIAASNFAASGFYYSLDGGPFILQATSPLVLTGLNASTHTVLVQYDLTATPCAFPISQVITQPAALVTSAAIISPATCLVGATLQATATGGTLNYQYQLEDGVGNILVAYQGNNTFTNQPAGNYIIRVKDANGCIDPIDNVLVVPVAPIPTATITSNLCIGTAPTFITVNATSGTAPYEYSINGGTFVTTNTFNNLPAGTYNIVVRDSFGCTYSVPALIVAPQLTANVSLTSGLDCTATPNASIAGTINGGTAPYAVQVSLNAGPLTATGITVTGNTFAFTTATAGNYVFTITDATGCASTTSQITVNPLPVLNAPTVTVLTNSICNGDTNGSISITQNGGQAPFVINVFNTTTSTPYGTQTTGLPAGAYTVTITDANSCTASSNVTITQPAPVFFDIAKTDIQCDISGAGTVAGSILVQNVSGGTQPYVYTLTNTEGFVAAYTTTTNENHPFTILQFGIYTVTVVDANGCQLVQNNINMASPPNSLNIDVSTATANCATGGTIIVTVTPSVIGGPYYFAIYTGAPYPLYTGGAPYQPADVPGGLSSTFTGLAPGVTYSFIVFDATTNCYYFQTALGPVPTLSTIAATATPNNVTCTGFADGSANVTFSNYSGTSVSYQIYSALTNAPVGVLGTSTGLTGAPVTINNFGTLAPGTYYILLTENNGPFNGCSQTTANFIISQSPVLLSLVANVTKNDNCNTNAGQITVTASNGTPAYSYQIVTAGGTAPTAATWAGQASNVFNVEGGSYDVYVKDAYNCIQMVNVPLVPTDSTPAITLALESTTLCNLVDGNYSIRVTRTAGLGIAPYTYSVDGGAFTSYTEDASNSFVVSGLNSGTHTVIIKDVNGCTFSQSITILPPVNGTATATIAATSNCGVSDGIITVAALGGSGSYTYSISPNPGAIITLSGNVFSNVPAGVYTVTITDNTTNCTFAIPVTIATPAPVTFTTSATSATCNGSSDGSIVVNLGAGNNNPPYSYQITGPVNLTQTSNVFNNLPAGVYTITVTSDRGCSSTINSTVIEPAAIAITAATVSGFDCTTGTNTTNFATITVSGVTGGSSTYINYEFILGGTTVQSGTSNVYTESNLLGGTYTINVYDNNGCVGTTTATIIPFVSITTPSVTVTNPITCTTNEEITINVVSTGGTPTLSYQVVGIGNTYSVGPQASPIFTGLGVGNYEVTITNTDTGCSVQTIHYVFSPNTFNVNVAVSNNVTCFGGTNGSIVVNFIDNDLTPTNDAGPFNYIITDQLGNPVTNGTTTSAGPVNINTLASGIYQLQATLIGSPFCTVNTNFTITQPAAALQIFATSTPITCVATADDGTISVSALDGWGAPYEFQLELGATIISPWSATSYFTGITPGTYTASVRDALGCSVSTTIVLTVPTPINASINGINTSLLCVGDSNGEITITGVTGGAGTGYLYSLVNVTTGNTSAPQTSNVFQNLGAGTYNVIVSDSFTCSAATGSITITEPSSLVAAQLTATAPTCLVPATITLTASGGTAPYRYSTSAGGPYTPFTGTVSFNVAPGNYQYFVIDANNCLEINRSIEVLPVIPVKVQVNTTNAVILCNGGSATITATATDGLGGYVYSLNPTPVGVVENNGVFQNVPAGTYTVTVISGDCNATSIPFTISQPTPIVQTSTSFNVTCNGLNDGIINVVATGGTGVIQYSISSRPLETVNSGLFTNLAPGTYTVSVQDQNGCFLDPILSFTITEPPVIVLSSLNIVPELCYGDGTDFTFSLTGGTTTPTVGYTVSVNQGAITQTSLTGNFSFLNLPAGTYVFVVTDANNCRDFQFTQIFAPGVDIQPIIDIDYLCTGNVPTNTVTVDVNPALPLSEFTFSLDGAAPVTTNVFNAVGPGSHVMVVNHISGCSEPIPFNIVTYDSPILTLAQTGLNQFTATTIGGAGGNEYILNGQDVGSTTVYTINQTGNYTVTVIDDNGCEDTKTIFMTFYDVTIPNYFTPDGDGVNDGWSPIYTDNFPNLVVYIFDRYSRKVVTLKQGDSWDGTYNNKPLPTGDYWYVIKLNGDSDTREFIGNFTLYR